MASVAAADFVGRRNESDMLASRAEAVERSRGLLLLSAPALGASELLKQFYDRLFEARGATIPVYFALSPSDLNARRAALRFARTFLRQTIAFRRGDANILNFAADLSELAAFADDDDAQWIERTIDAVRTAGESTDERFVVKNCLSAPLRAAAATGARFFLMFDDLHRAASFSGDADFVAELKEIYAPARIPFVFSGHRRFLYDAVKSGEASFETVELEPLGFADAGRLAENLARRYALEINAPVRDLIAVQTAGNPFFIKSLLRAARDKNVDLHGFQTAQQIYADEIFGGAIGKFYDDALIEIAPNAEEQKKFVALLDKALTNEPEKTPIDEWLWQTQLGGADFRRALRLSNAREIVRLSSNFIEPMSENEVLSDYIRARFRLESLGDARALVVGEALNGFLKRAPKTMAKFYRQNSSLGLRELLAAFDGRDAPAALLDYAVFARDLKGATDEEISKYLNGDAETIRLPRVVYAAHAGAFYPPLLQVAERFRSCVAFGFDERGYADADEIVWLAAEIDSKLEATPETAEFWCDRLEMVAVACDFPRHKIWLVAPEGFSAEALDVLKERDARGASRRQVQLLAKFLKVENVAGEEASGDEYEMVVPMGDDKELIAAHAVAEIARRHDFSPKAINQIKTALVEACINATEHSHSLDRRIYQKFTVEDDRITITVSNRGVRLADRTAVEFMPDEGRRGWGLKLMKTLMDEVKFEQVDDGTRVSMVKFK